jgi:hypothetical protein
VQGALKLVDQEVEIAIEPARLFADDVVIRLPKRLAVLRPAFRLHHAGAVYEPDENAIADGRIELVFDGVSEFDADAGPLELRIESTFATLVLTFRQLGPDAYALDGISLGG